MSSLTLLLPRSYNVRLGATLLSESVWRSLQRHWLRALQIVAGKEQAPPLSERAPDTSEAAQVWTSELIQGDPRAFQDLFTTYYPSLRRVVQRYVHSREIAEDLVSDVFFKLWRERTHLTIRTNLRAYLFAAARNSALDHLKHERVEWRWRQRSESQIQAESLTSAEDHFGQQLMDRDLEEAVHRAVEQLPGRVRETLMFRWQFQLSYAEIAQIMGISVKSVENNLARAVKALRTILPHYL